MTPALDTILAAVEQMGAVKLELDGGSASVRVGARLVARIDLRRDQVLVNAPPDTIPTLQRAFPSSRPIATGVMFDLADGQNEPAALGAIRRRVDVEKLAWQLRVGSP
jgi:hypothetical protein